MWDHTFFPPVLARPLHLFPFFGGAQGARVPLPLLPSRPVICPLSLPLDTMSGPFSSWLPGENLGLSCRGFILLREGLAFVSSSCARSLLRGLLFFGFFISEAYHPPFFS